jgi:hypothetical protein
MGRLVLHATMRLHTGGHVGLVTDTAAFAPLIKSFTKSEYTSHGCTRGTAGVETLDEPPVGQGELLVSGRVVGVCGTDREIAEGGYGEPPQGEARERSEVVASAIEETHSPRASSGRSVVRAREHRRRVQDPRGAVAT